jgi:protein SCO1/2
MKLSKILSITFVLLILGCNTQHSTLLPYYGPKKLLASGDTAYHRIGKFDLINQNQNSINEHILQSKISVVNFFFATCQSICPIMSKHLMHLQDSCLKFNSRLSGNSVYPFQFISITVNPEHDSPDVLKNYAKSYNAKSDFWTFLTGSKSEIYHLAKHDFLVNALENNSTSENTAYTLSSEEFIHSELLMLIDPKGHIRGLYNGTDESSVLQLWDALKRLSLEFKKIH